MVALWRRSFKSFQNTPNRTTRPIDADLDMRRPRPAPSKMVRHFSRLLRWMLPEGNSMGPPMRSIQRESEEEFPSNDL